MTPAATPVDDPATTRVDEPAATVESPRHPCVSRLSVDQPADPALNPTPDAVTTARRQER